MLGVIVFAHGSRDPLWRAPVEAVARRIAERAPGTLARTAYLELTEPDLPSAARELVAAGATTLRVLPLFFGMGKHAREDLPQLMDALQREHPQVVFERLPTAGEDPQLIDLLAALAVKEGA
ncbi:MAG: CbiX/SirB N-terminal domain-containing protein [Hydrogenophaga sp.]|uniref:Cobalamin biosynthesis protein CbiX n=1 Tax=Hydrogenophaga crocea TaxID=2716225 RepID=A0A6G8IFY0_9BURK|nr:MULTISPECIES: CbiX/SirB N-terminal domain-containing protein [Hydrogenophaga]MBL0946166.1 CbiX/SirB N-terminal domain-containing protein [Hydrogenophaga sp.]QIM52124.1 cobalamin biosynthesis protein CbiX [Hydrogenophaga crocea]